jgi:hypothetical protein
MNVASLKLCKELYELSGWIETPFAYDISYADNWLRHIEDFPKNSRERQGVSMIPAYDLGYLLRKLPMSVEIRNHHLDKLKGVVRGGWAGDMMTRQHLMADTPEDALCKLCIELFKQGILTKEVI